MSGELNGAEIFRDAFYSWETWAPAVKIMIFFAAAAVLLLLFKHLLKALERFIKRIRR